MPKIKLFQFGGGESETEFDEKLAEGKINRDLIFRSVQSYLTNQRQGTRSTKTRAEVAGTGKKPWPQKHTGRARHGDRQSPIWAGGGVAFGPQPKNFEFKLPKKMKKAALKSAVRDRFQSERVTLIDSLSFEVPKTKEAISLLERLELTGKGKVLVVFSSEENNLQVRKSFSNIPKVSCVLAQSVHPYEIIKHENLLLTSGGLEELVARVN
jgi:large subunit ribosomal protein L4